MKQKETYPIFNAIFYTIMIASAYWIYSTYTDRNPSQPKQVVQVKNDTPKQSATPAKPELTEEQKKQKDFNAERTVRAWVLEAAIKKSAFDPDALKINRPVYYTNGVCVSANGKNRFGAYVGFQDYCYLIDNGVWKYSGPT
jgi:hypothetical protein